LEFLFQWSASSQKFVWFFLVDRYYETLVDKYRTFCTATAEKVTLTYFGIIPGMELSLLMNSQIAISCSG
jgi:hypothetical protein